MNITNLDLNLLFVFDALATHRSVTIAAAHLNLSQPATSHALNRLREALNDELFVRSSKGMFPTDKALRLQDGVREILERIQVQLFEEEIFEPLNTTRLFKICSTDNELATFINHAFGKLSMDAPSARFHFVNPDPRHWYAEMESGRTDLTIGVDIHQRPAIEYEKLFSSEFVCLVRQKCETIKTRLTLKKYLAHPHILVAPLGSGSGPVDIALRKLGKQREICVIMPNFSLVPCYLLSRDNIFTVPKNLAEKLLAIYPLKSYKPPIALPPLQIDMVWHKRTTNSSPHKWLREQIRNAVKETILS